MKLKIKIIMCALIALLLVSTRSFSDTKKYYNSDGTEMSAETYQKESKILEKKYLQAKKYWITKKSDPVLKCIELSGMDQVLDSFPSILEAQAAQRKLPADMQEIDDKIAKIFKDVFDPNIAKHNIYQYCKNNMDQTTIKDLLKWYETPLGRRITEEENEAGTMQGQENMMRYISGFQTKPPPPERVAVIQNLVQKGKFVDSGVEVVTAIAAGTRNSVNSILPKEKKVSKEEIKNTIAQMKPILEKVVRQQITLTCFYTYRNISNEDLGKYADFLASKSGSKFNEIAERAINDTVSQIFDEVADKLVASTK